MEGAKGGGRGGGGLNEGILCCRRQCGCGGQCEHCEAPTVWSDVCMHGTCADGGRVSGWALKTSAADDQPAAASKILERLPIVRRPVAAAGGPAHVSESQ